MITLISHFYNEEFLLPFWLDHHRRIFDHGILIDYDSTDMSTEIIKTIVPTWKIIRSRNREFDYIEVDREVAEIEQAISGWKMTLNTTEFLVHPDLRQYTKDLERRSIRGIKTKGLMMIDPKGLKDIHVDQNIPLLAQRHYGYIETDFPERNKLRRSRLLHMESHGHYTAGRHDTTLPKITFDQNLLLCWYGFSPYQQITERKLQIQNRIPRSHIKSGMHGPHKITREELDQIYLGYEKLAGDLRIKVPTLDDYIKRIYPGYT